MFLFIVEVAFKIYRSTFGSMGKHIFYLHFYQNISYHLMKLKPRCCLQRLQDHIFW